MTTLTKDGITWTLSGTPVHGTYLNGDHWVVGPVTVTAISPATATIGTRHVHGSMKNVQHRPMYDGVTYYSDTFWQGLDSLPAGSEYDDDLNDANDLPSLALVAGDSLVSVESDIAQSDQWWSAINRAAVLTVVTAAPGENEFRPPYWNEDAPTQPYVWNDGMLNALPSIFPVSYAANMAAMVASANKLWLTVGNNEGRYRLQPKLHLEPYYRDHCNDLGYMFLALCSKIPAAQKRDLAIALCQQGIDFAWAVKNGQYQANTHATGMKPVIVLMAMLLSHTDFDDVNGLCRGDLTALYYNLVHDHRLTWGEDGQTFYVAETSSGVYNWGEGGYTAADVGNVDWGNTHWTGHGNSDVADWLYQHQGEGFDLKAYNNAYRQCCSASSWVGIYLALLSMGAAKMWNHNPYFDWVRRWIDAAPMLGLSLQGMPDDVAPLWNLYKPQSMASMRQIGVAEPGKPKMSMDTVADNKRPWRVRIDVGMQVQAVGLLVRAEETALHPRRSYYGASTTGLVFLDEATYMGHLLITTDANGVAVVDMLPIDEVGETYTIQAAFLLGGQIVTTNALEITVTAAA